MIGLFKQKAIELVLNRKTSSIISQCYGVFNVGSAIPQVVQLGLSESEAITLASQDRSYVAMKMEQTISILPNGYSYKGNKQ